jgi:predicted permease
MGWPARVLNVFRRQKRDGEIDRELAFHLAERADDLSAAGMADDAARREAARRFGNYLIYKERTRDMDISRTIDALASDARYGLRQLRLNPGFAIVAVLSLALGIGANSAMFQLLNAVRLRPLSVARPHELAVVARGEGDFLADGWSTGRNESFTYAQLEEISRRQQAFSGLAAFGTREFNLSEGGEVRFASGLYITPNFLSVLGVTPERGAWTPADADPRDCADAGVLLNHAFWQREFGGDPGAIGRTISLEGRRFPIRAVTPPSFTGVEPGYRFDVAIPVCADGLMAEDGQGRMSIKWAWWLTMIGRLNPGWSVDRAAAHLHEISPVVFRESVPDTYRPEEAAAYLKNRLTVESAHAGVSSIREEYEASLWILLAMTGFVLLIACANIANLLLARASARERDAVVRQALGASRGRLIAQLMTESALLAGCGAVLGTWLAHALGRGLVTFLGGPEQSLYVPLGVDWRVVGFTSSVAAGTCLLFGVAPALRATAVTPSAVMHGGRGTAASADRHRLRRALVVSQVALSLMLLVGAVLFAQSLRNLRATATGMATENVLTANVRSRAPEDGRLVLFQEAEARVRRLPDVVSAASVVFRPFGGAGWNQVVYADGASSADLLVWFNRVSPGYFETVGTTLVAGRDFSAADRVGRPDVAIVNQQFARRVFGDVDPIGRRFSYKGAAGEADPAFTIVGLVADSKYGGLRETPRAIAFLPLAQDAPPPFLSIVVRARGAFAPVLAGIEREIAAVDRNLLVEFKVLDAEIAESLLRDRLIANLSGGFGLLALVLSTLGLYGVMSYMVARRRPEIGVRMALGARRLDILALVLREAARLVVAGVLVGIIGAMWLSRYAESLLFGVASRDVRLIAVAAGVLVLTALVAALMPARRAAGTDAAVVLRSD